MSEAYKEFLRNCHLAITRPESQQLQGTIAESDPVHVYNRFGGATLASLLINCYKAMKSSKTRDKDVVANEIHILHALRAAEKNNIPEYLKYRDEGHMYFPCEKLLPFLEEVDVCVNPLPMKQTSCLMAIHLLE